MSLSRHPRVGGDSVSSDSESLITEHIDLWTSSIKARNTQGRGSSKKRELYGIKKLRELILELAVSGKLVPQDPNDEPASVLLKRIAGEKVQLIKDNKIKKQKPLPENTDEKKPFELPDGWDWVRLCDIGVIASSSRVHKKDWQTEGIPFYRAREIVKLSRFGTVDNELYISESLFGDLSEKGFVPELNDLMITGVGTIGVPYVVQKTDKFYFKDASVLIFKNLHCLFSGYLFQFMKSPYWYRSVHEGSMGTTVHTLTITRANEVLVPVPPEKEQHRIVAKVDELMALCDQLEQQTESSLDAHKLLVDTLLASLLKPAEGSLTDARDAKELSDNWARLANHFDTLITSDYAVEQLKQTILQLAVMGKLVPQDPNDEPASQLLKRIAAEKEQLVKDKKIKKQKPLPEITTEEKPFDLQEGWDWERFGQLGYDLGGGTPSKSNSEYWNGAIPWVSPKDMKLDYIYSAQDFITDVAIKNSTVKIIPIGSLLMVVRGMILAHSFPVAITKVPVVINQDMKALVFSELDDNYILLMMKGFKGDMVNLVDRSSHGTCKLISEKLWGKVVGIPPLNEQHRIVAKVDELMTLCDHLKVRLKDAQTTQLQLTDTVVDEALN